MLRLCSLLLVALLAVLATAVPTRHDDRSGGPSRMKKWYNWNNDVDVQKKWYDWQDVPSAEKIRKRDDVSGDMSFPDANRYEWRFTRL